MKITFQMSILTAGTSVLVSNDAYLCMCMYTWLKNNHVSKVSAEHLKIYLSKHVSHNHILIFMACACMEASCVNKHKNLPM